MPSVDQFKALGVRLVLLLHFALVVWRVTTTWNDRFWMLALAILPMLMEGAYTIVRRNGVEWKLFSLCFFFYLMATLPGIWLLEIKKTQSYQNANKTQIENVQVAGLEIPVRLSPDTWVLVVEEMMLYLMILGRWMLPRGDVGREQLTQLLFGFVGIASDIMELFGIFDDDSSIRHNDVMTYTILSVWSLSVLQFTLTFATAHRPRRARGLRMGSDEITQQQEIHKRSVLQVELLATILSLFMQDGPFLVVRLYTIITYNIITYSLVFFTAKNTLVIMLLVYKVFLLLNKICCPKPEREHDDEEDEMGEGGGKMSKEQLKRRYGERFGEMEIDVERMSKKEKEAYLIAQADILKIKEKQMIDRRMHHVVDTGDMRKRRGDAEEKIHVWTFDAGSSGGLEPLDQTRQPAGGASQQGVVKQPGDTKQSGGTINNGGMMKEEALGRGDRQDSLTASEMEDEAIGELQKVIDGPGTPAKPMKRTKKHDKLMVRTESRDDETGKDLGGRGDEKPLGTSVFNNNNGAVDSDEISLSDSLKRKSHGSSHNSGEVSDDSGVPSVRTTTTGFNDPPQEIMDHRL